MPKTTFDNLPDSKKSAFLEACFEEFALNNYEKASISRIVKKLGIAKGSIYQYFDNKRDLYFFLIEYATRLRLENVKELFDSENKLFKDVLIENYMEKTKFDQQHPAIGGFLYTVMKERFADELGNMEMITKKRIIELTQGIIQKYLDKNQVRSDLDADIVAYAIVELQMGIYDFLEIKYGIDYRENIKKKKPVIQLSEKEIQSNVSQFAEIIMHGIKAKNDDIS